MKKFTDKTQLILDSVQAGEQGIAMQANRYQQQKGAGIENKCSKYTKGSPLYQQCMYDAMYQTEDISEQRVTTDDVRGIKDTSGLIAFFKSLMKKKDDDEENGMNENYDQLDENLLKIIRAIGSAIAGTGRVAGAAARDVARRGQDVASRGVAKADTAVAKAENFAERLGKTIEPKIDTAREKAGSMAARVERGVTKITDETPDIRRGRRAEGGESYRRRQRGEAAGRTEKNIGRYTDPIDDVLSRIGGTRSRMRASGSGDQRGTIGDTTARGLRALNRVTGKEVPADSTSAAQRAYRFLFGEPRRGAIPNASNRRSSTVDRLGDMIMGNSRQDRPVGTVKRIGNLLGRGAALGTAATTATETSREIDRALDTDKNNPYRQFKRGNLNLGVDLGATEYHPAYVIPKEIMNRVNIDPEELIFGDNPVGRRTSDALRFVQDGIADQTGIKVRIPGKAYETSRRERLNNSYELNSSLTPLIERDDQDELLDKTHPEAKTLEQKIRDSLDAGKERGEEFVDAGKEKGKEFVDVVKEKGKEVVDSGRERTAGVIDNINDRIGDTVNRADGPMERIADYLQKLIPQDNNMSLGMLGARMKAAIESTKTQAEKIPELAALKKEMQAYKPNLSPRPNIGLAPKYRKRVNTKGF